MQQTTTGLHLMIFSDDPAAILPTGRSVVEIVEDLGHSGDVCPIHSAAHCLDEFRPDVGLALLSGSVGHDLAPLFAMAREFPIIAIYPFEERNAAAEAVANGLTDYLFIEDLTLNQLEKSIAYSISGFQMKKRLEEQEQQYMRIFNESPVPNLIYDIGSLKFLDVNRSAIKKYGYSKEEFLEMGLEDIRPYDEIDNLREAINKAITQPYAVTYGRHQSKTGRIFQVEAHGCRIDFHGKQARLVIVNDQSEREEFEQAIRKSEERFKNLVYSGGDLITTINQNGELEYVSPNHRKILGWTTDELKNQDVNLLVHEEDRPAVREFYASLTEHQESVTSRPYRFLSANGEYVWIETIGTNALEDPSIRGIVLNSRDVSARVRHERTIEASNDRFIALTKATSDAIYDYDFQNNLLTFAGPGYQQLIGYRLPNHMADYSFFESGLHEDDRLRVIRFMEKAARSKKRHRFELEYRFRRKDGSYADILDRFEILRKNGKAIRKIGAMQDISSRVFQETILNFEKDIYQANANPKIGFDGAMEMLVDSLSRLIPGARATVAALDENSEIQIMASNGNAREIFTGMTGKAPHQYSDPCNTAVFSGKRIIIPNLETEPEITEAAQKAMALGVKSYWTFPIRKSSGKVIGGLILAFPEARNPLTQEVTLVERASILLGVILDNRLAQLETQRAKERYDIVAKATSDTIWDWNIKDNKFDWNKGIRGVFGYKQHDIGETSAWWFDRIHPEDSIRVSVKLYAFLEQKTEKWQDEYRFACADGSYKYVYDRAFLVKDSNGKAIRMIGAMQDVTKEKAEEQRLKLMETVITQMKDAVIITESGSQTDTIPKILFVNPAFTQITGFSPAEVIGKSPTTFLKRRALLGHSRKLLQMLKNKQEFRFEATNLKKNDEPYWMDLVMLPVTNKEGHHSHWISILRDVTEAKRQESEKEQLIRELTQNNKDLKQFSYITSHNLRAPLSNLTGLMNLIEDMPIENEELQTIVNGFRKSTHLLNETINDLVKVVIIKDNPSIQKEEVLIKDVFENVFGQLSFMINLYKPIIKLQIEKVSILNINKAYLESILLNLLTNAIKYRASDRKLRIFISTKIVNDKIQLIFKDNGIGIDMERNRDKIFGLYQRFHNYPDSKGLGLYLVKSQVESMGGFITVESTVDKGTSFTITFKKQT